MEKVSVLLARIDERQKAHDDKFESFKKAHDDKLDAILEQCLKTNGRVTNLETDRVSKLEHWKSRWSGVLIALSALATVASIAIGIYEAVIHN